MVRVGSARRCIVAGAVVVSLAALSGCGVPAPERSAPSAAATPGRTVTGGAAGPSSDPSPRHPSAHPASPSSPSATPSVASPPMLPRGGRTLFPRNRVVAWYGTDAAPSLGVLGRADPDAVWPGLQRAARHYDQPGKTVLPAYELIVTVAQAAPGRDGLYRSRTSPTRIDRYLAAAHRHHALLILDVQPGRSDFVTETRWLKPWLRDPSVALALDPEWRMGPGQVPGRTIGSVDSAEVNKVSSWLDGVVKRHHLPQKLLLVHRFTTRMITHPAALRRHASLALTINMDGFGSPKAKLAEYRRFAADGRFPVGLKLFYDQDTPLMSAERVLGLHRPPAVVEYQ